MPYSNRCFILHSMIPLATGTIWKNKLTMSLFKLCFRHIEKRMSGDKSSTQRLCRLCVCVNRAGVSHSSMFLYSKHVVATKKNNIRNKTKKLMTAENTLCPAILQWNTHGKCLAVPLKSSSQSQYVSDCLHKEMADLCIFLRFIFTLLQLISETLHMAEGKKQKQKHTDT